VTLRTQINRAGFFALLACAALDACSGGGHATTPDPPPSATPQTSGRPSQSPSAKPSATPTGKASSSPTSQASATPAASSSPALSISIAAEYPLPTSGAPVAHPAFAGDRSIWYAEPSGLTLYSVTTSGVVTAHPSAYQGTGAIVDVIAAPDGSIYYVVNTATSAPNQIRRMTTSGSDTLFAAPANTCISAIAFDSPGTSLYGSSYAATTPGSNATTCNTAGAAAYLGSIVRLELKGGTVHSNVTLPVSASQPGTIALGPDGRMWAYVVVSGAKTELVAESGRGTDTTYALSPQPAATSLTVGPYASLYYAGAGAGTLAKINDAGASTTYAFPSMGTLSDVELDADKTISFVAAPATGATTSTVGIFSPGAPHLSFAYPKVTDSLVPGPDGNLYVFEHAAAAPSSELLAKVAVSN